MRLEPYDDDGKAGAQQPATDQEAMDAVELGDGVAVVNALHRSYILEATQKGLMRQWQSSWMKDEDAQDFVARAVDAVRVSVNKGNKIASLPNYIFRAAHRMACNEDRRRRTQSLISEAVSLEEYEEANGQIIFFDPGLTLLEREQTIQEAGTVLYGLIDKFCTQNIRYVMLFILEEALRGNDELTDKDISSALSLSLDTVRTSKARGRRKIKALLSEKGITLHIFDIAGIWGDKEHEEE